MRAVVYDQVGGPLTVRDLPAPECPPDGAVVRVEATGVCRSDWHAWRGHDPVALPHVPGHEFAGVVDRVGPQVTGFAPGDRVTAPFVNGCGRCAWCRDGQAQVCPDQTQPGFTHPGSYAEEVVVRAADTNLVGLPDEMDAVTAASLGCRFATAYRALVARAGLRPGETVAVVGCGGVGLSAVMIAAALGARVVAVDPSPAALERAGELGAAHVVADADPVRAVRQLVPDGVHVAMDAVGSARTAEIGVRLLRRQGRHVQVGLMVEGDAAAPLPWDLVLAHELTVLGSHGLAAVDYPALFALIRDRGLRPERLVGAVVGLADAPAALTAMDHPVGVRAGTTVIALDRG